MCDQLDKLAPEERAALERIIDRAGTSDADWFVLQAAAELLAEATEACAAALVARLARCDGNDELSKRLRAIACPNVNKPQP